MTRAFLSIQTACVISVGGLVGLPQSQLRSAPTNGTEVPLWQATAQVAANRDVSLDWRLISAESEEIEQIGFGSLAARTAPSPTRTDQAQRRAGFTERASRSGIAREVTDAGGRFNAIFGWARTALNTPVAYARVVIRNLITGQIEARATADRDGQFTFLDLPPTGYIVEILGDDGTVIATSEAMTVVTGQAQAATIRIATISTVSAVVGTVQTPTAQEVLRAAADDDVTTVNQLETLSPRQ